MKMPKLFTFIGLCAALLFLAACGNVESVDNAEQVDLEVDNMTLNEVIDFAKNQGLGVQQLVHEYEVAGEPMVGFLPINKPSDLEGAAEQWPELYKGMILDLIDSERQAGFGDTSTLALQNAANSKAVPEFKVSGIVAEADKNETAHLKSNPKVSSFIIRSEIEGQTEPQQDQNTDSLETTGFERWVPTSGTVVTDESRYGTANRFVTQYMEWSSNRFARNRGYEHDFFLNNYRGTSRPGTYFQNLVGVRGLPIVQYASTSWPKSSNPYLDTRLGDPLGEIAYTIGAVYAENFRSRTRYKTYIRVKQGNTNRDNAKLTASLQVPSRTHSPSRPCGNQWCMFTEDQERLVPAWDIPVPGRKSWRY